MKYGIPFLSLLLTFFALGQNIQRVVPTVAELVASDPRTFASAPVFSSSTFTAVVTTTGGSAAGEGTKTWRWNSSSTASTNTYANNGPLAYTGSLSLGRWENVLTAKEQSIQSQLDAVTVPENSLYTVSNTNQLRSLTAATLTNYAQIYMAGYYAALDGGGGFLSVDTSDTDSVDDGGAVFVVDGIRVKANLEIEPSIRRWGAESSSIVEPATGSAARIQRAVDWAYANGGATLACPTGDYWLEDTLHLKYRVSLRGPGTTFSDGSPSAVNNETAIPSFTSQASWRKAGTCQFILKSGVNKGMVDWDPTGGYQRIAASPPIPAKIQFQSKVEGIVFHGNGDNQTKYNCHALDLKYAWGVAIEDCGFFRVRGYELFILDCNTINVRHNISCGQNTWGKSIVLYSCADTKVIDNEFGAGAGPVIWITGGQSSWVATYQQNFLYNAQRQRFTVSALSSSTITITGHTYETGMPVEVLAGSGGTIPSQAVESTCYWAIRISSSQIKLATTYENAMAGTSMTLSGASGTWYVYHGEASGIYASHDAFGITINGNRCEQNYDSGITLARTRHMAVNDNILCENGYDNLTLAATGEDVAGIKMRNQTYGTVIQGCVFFAYTATYPQAYGVWNDSGSYTNTVGFNTYKDLTTADTQNDASGGSLIVK